MPNIKASVTFTWEPMGPAYETAASNDDETTVRTRVIEFCTKIDAAVGSLIPASKQPDGPLQEIDTGVSTAGVVEMADVDATLEKALKTIAITKGQLTERTAGIPADLEGLYVPSASDVDGLDENETVVSFSASETFSSERPVYIRDENGRIICVFIRQLAMSHALMESALAITCEDTSFKDGKADVLVRLGFVVPALAATGGPTPGSGPV